MFIMNKFEVFQFEMFHLRPLTHDKAFSVAFSGWKWNMYSAKTLQLWTSGIVNSLNFLVHIILDSSRLEWNLAIF